VNPFSSLQFLADENIHPGFVLWLQKQGYHVDSISGLKLNGSSDEDVLKYAEQNGMVVITHDSDFGRIIFTSHDLKTGVIYLVIP
jgi:predicted nuclease of predicted toxin-antitoxin system